MIPNLDSMCKILRCLNNAYQDNNFCALPEGKNSRNRMGDHLIKRTSGKAAEAVFDGLGHEFPAVTGWEGSEEAAGCPQGTNREYQITVTR